MKTKLIAVIAAVMLVGVYPAEGDLVFDSGHNTFDDSYPYYKEVWVINDAHLHVLGGATWKLELMHYATANIHGGDIDWVFANDSSLVSIRGGTFNMFGAWNDSKVYLYAYNVTYYPTGGLKNDGWVEGIYYSNDIPFSFSLYTDTSYSHISIVPEPSSLIMLMFGSLLLKRRR